MTEKQEKQEQPEERIDIQTLIDLDRKARLAKVQAGLAELLREHRCRLEAVPGIEEGKIVARIQIVAD